MSADCILARYFPSCFLAEQAASEMGEGAIRVVIGPFANLFIVYQKNVPFLLNSRGTDFISTMSGLTQDETIRSWVHFSP